MFLQNYFTRAVGITNTTQFSMLRNILLQTTKSSLGTVTRTGLQTTTRSLFSLASNRSRTNQTIFASTTQCSNTLIFKRYKRLNFKKLKRLASEEEVKAPDVKMNEDLSTFEKFLLIGVDKKPVGVISYQEAYAMAKKEGVDLVLVQANATPPVAKLLAPTDKKLQKIKASKSAGLKEKIKEVQFSEVITEHDMQVKITKLRSMLKRQYRVRVRIQFKDRKNFDQELAREIMLNVSARVKDLALRDSRTGFKIESSAVYSLLVPRSLLPEDATDESEPPKKKEKTPTDKNKPTSGDKAAATTSAATSAATSTATEARKSKPHPAEAMQEEDIEEDLAEEMEEEEGEGDGLADLAPEEIEELLAQIEKEEKQKKQSRAPEVVAAPKKGEQTKNTSNNNNKGKDNNANKQADNRPNQKDNKNQNARNNNNDNKSNNKRNR